MLYKLLTKEETRKVETTINQLLSSSAMTDILVRKRLVKITDRRTDVFLVLPEDIPLFKQLASNLSIRKGRIVHTRVKLGFFIHEKFLIGIESLAFLAPLTQKRIRLDTQNTKKFIYGKDIDLTTDSLQKQTEDLEDKDTIMIFSHNDIPIGYAKIISNKRGSWLQNLVDVGIFIRSEKTSF